MDQQDPRVTAARLSGRGTDETLGYESAAGERPSTTAATRRSRGVPASPPATGDDSRATPPDVEQRTRELRADIEQTREEMSETVSAIQDRLRPSAVASNAVGSIKNAATAAASEVAESQPVRYIGANPIPSAMVGVGIMGIAWLALRGRDRHTSFSNRTYERGLYPAAASGGPVGNDEESAGTGGYAQSLKSSGRAYGDSFYQQRQVGMGAQNYLTRTWNETPLLVGAAAVIAGAIVGLSIPESERERRLMGDTRDRFVDAAQRTVQDKVTQVQDAATEAIGRVQEVAKDVTGLTGERS